MFLLPQGGKTTMGNTLGRGKTVKVMKINGETIKLKAPVKAGDVVKDYPGHDLLESEAVKHFGVRAKPLEPWHDLKPRRLYFLVELPSFQEEKGPRRVRSGINMTAKDRLESLMLSRRSVSDLSGMKPRRIGIEESNKAGEEAGAMRVKMRLPKAEVDKLMKESRDEAEAAEKIVGFCLANKAAGGGDRDRCCTTSNRIGKVVSRPVSAERVSPTWHPLGEFEPSDTILDGLD